MGYLENRPGQPRGDILNRYLTMDIVVEYL